MNDPTEGHELDHLNPILLRAVESITKAMAESFDQIWTRDDAPQLVDGFLAEQISFVIRRDGVLIVHSEIPGEAPAEPVADPEPPRRRPAGFRPPDDDTPPEQFGMYL